jgi:hypothetical protein
MHGKKLSWSQFFKPRPLLLEVTIMEREAHQTVQSNFVFLPDLRDPLKELEGVVTAFYSSFGRRVQTKARGIGKGLTSCEAGGQIIQFSVFTRAQ